MPAKRKIDTIVKLLVKRVGDLLRIEGFFLQGQEVGKPMDDGLLGSEKVKAKNGFAEV